MHHLALIAAVGPLPPAFVSRETSRIVRPWALLACAGIAYMAYAAYDSLPGLLQYAPRSAPPVLVARAESPKAAATSVRVVTKCIENGIVTSYSDAGCRPGARTQRILVKTQP